MEKKSFKQFQAKALKDTRRRQRVTDPAQMVIRSFPIEAMRFPLMIRPTVSDVNLAEWVATQKDVLRAELLKHGAILFRGFDIQSVAEFSEICGNLAESLFGEYGDLPVEDKSEKVYKSTPYPADKPILFHNESSHMAQWPRFQFFHCVQNSLTGGETPLVDCRTLYEALPAEYKAILSEKGLMYLRNFKEGLDVPWQHFFQTESRDDVARKCQEAGFEHTWTGPNSLQVKQYAPAIIQHPVSKCMSFFNQIELHHVAFLDEDVRASLAKVFEEADFPRNVYFGDGSPIPDEMIRFIAQLYEQYSVALPWEKGDIIALENMLVAHARLPYTGARKIVVAMGDMVRQAEVTPAGAPA